MKIVALEEHLTTKGIADAGGLPDGTQLLTPLTTLLDLGAGRLAAMDDQGIDVQVLSVTTPAVQGMPPGAAVPLARDANDLVAAAVRAHPDRLQGFATLPTPDPAAAADELRRGIGELGFKGAMLNGRTGDRNIDDPALEPVWAAAAELRAPVYLHPQLPPEPVIDAYYRGLGRMAEFLLAGGGIGWHYETGVQLLRLILSGAFDRHPELQVIVGHWGEVVLFYLDRLDAVQRWLPQSIARPVSDYFRTNVYVTGSGIYSERYLRWTREVVGVDRMLYSTDYPYAGGGGGEARRFLEEADLTDGERTAIAHATWEKLTSHLG